MAELLGLTVTHFPALRNRPEGLTSVLKGTIAGGWGGRPELANPKNWPEAMQREWGEDEGLSSSIAAQEHAVGQLRKLRAELDAFQPDLILMLYRDHRDGWRANICPQYWIMAHNSVETNLFPRNNVFGEDPGRVDTIAGHREAALYLTRQLQDRGHNPLYTLEPEQPGGIDHHVQAGLVHLNWDKRVFDIPVVPFGIDPIAYRERSNVGLSARDPESPRPLTSKEAFELGRSIAQAYRASKWKVALVAATGWSNYHNSLREQGRVCQEMEADLPRFEQWKSNRFVDWADGFTHDELDLHGQWDLLTSVVLAGAMTELGSKVRHADLYANPLLISNQLTTIFEVR
jgi:hypothetical protein